jgi:predicted transcriptional regulator
MESLNPDAIYNVEQISNLLQLTPKTVRMYLKKYGYPLTVNKYRLIGTEVKEFFEKLRSKEISKTV